MTLRQYLYLGLIASLLLAGWQFRDLWQDHADKKEWIKYSDKVSDQAAKTDQLVTDNINEGAAIDRGTAKVKSQRQEIETHDQAYRDYLDRPLPAESLRLYRAAAEASAAATNQGADDAGAAADEADPGSED